MNKESNVSTKLPNQKQSEVVLEDFSEWLGQVIASVNNTREATFGVYQIPVLIEKKIKKNVEELMALQREAHAAACTIRQLQMQRAAILKEIDNTKKDIRILGRKEESEIDAMVNATWPELKSNWNKLKGSKSIKEITTFYNELQELSEALNAIQESVNRKLSKLSSQKNLKMKKKVTRNRKDYNQSVADADDEDSDSNNTSNNEDKGGKLSNKRNYQLAFQQDSKNNSNNQRVLNRSQSEE